MADDNNLDDWFAMLGPGISDWFERTFNPNKYGKKQAALKESDYNLKQASSDYVAAYNALLPKFQEGANMADRKAEYDLALANRQRGSQQDLGKLMESARQGQSISALKNSQASGDNFAQAVTRGAAGITAAGQAGARNAQTTGSGVADEQINSLSSQGDLVSNIRSADQGVSGARAQLDLNQRSMDDTMRAYAAKSGATMSDSVRNSVLDYYKLIKRLEQAEAEAAKTQNKQEADFAGTAIKTVVSGI